MKRAPLASLVAVLLAQAAAHATLVFGELTVAPDPPRAGTAFAVTVTLEDPTLAPLEDAIVILEFRPLAADASGADPSSAAAPALRDVRLAEVTPAVYRGEVSLPTTGSYEVRVRDRTFSFEEAAATVIVAVGGAPVAAVPFVLPPTQVGPRGLATWLVWLIGVPVLAGAVVTALVLWSGRGDRAKDSGTAQGPRT